MKNGKAKISSKTLLIASQGGHLTELLKVFKNLDTSSAVVLSNLRGDRKNFGSEIDYEVIINPHTSGIKYILSMFQAMRLWLRYRPELIVTTGAGLVIPYLVLARVFSVKVIYIESIARMGSMSRTAKFANQIGFEVNYPSIKILK